VERVVAAFAERGVDVLVDGAHAPGMLPLDLTAVGAAYYTGNFHKWCCAPKGAALLHVRRDRQDRVRPLVVSHGATASRRDRSRFRLEFDWTGTDDPSAWLAVPDALRFLGGLLPGGWPALRAHNRRVALEQRARLATRLGARLPCPDAMVGSIAAVPLPDSPHASASPQTGDPLQRALFDRHRVEVPIVVWPDAPRRWVRISAQVYNDPSQYARLAEALVEELARERVTASS
jgi:isopenicillin-N epimerase